MVWNGSEQDEQKIIDDAGGFAMACVPWQLGLKGNCRATNAVTRASVLYENSVIRAEGWGVLSTDGVDAPEKYGDYTVNLTARDCLVEITGESGYGSYSIGACKNVFDRCKMNIPDYALIVANEYASGEFINGTTANSGRFGVMRHQNQGDVLKVKDSTLNTGMATFLIKGCYPVIEVENSVLNSGNKVILQLMDSDDPGMGAYMAEIATAATEKIGSHDNASSNFEPVVMFGKKIERCCTDARASFRNMEITGDTYNSTTNASAVGMVMPEPEDGAPGGPPGAPPEMQGEPGEPGGPGGFVPPPPSTESPINLILDFDNTVITGVLSSSESKHSVSVIRRENLIELGQVTNTVKPAVNNGLIVTLGNGTMWNVIGECFLTALTLDDSSGISGAVMYVDGVRTDIVPGSYRGTINLVPIG